MLLLGAGMTIKGIHTPGLTDLALWGGVSSQGKAWVQAKKHTFLLNTPREVANLCHHKASQKHEVIARI